MRLSIADHQFEQLAGVGWRRKDESAKHLLSVGCSSDLIGEVDQLVKAFTQRSWQVRRHRNLRAGGQENSWFDLHSRALTE